MRDDFVDESGGVDLDPVVFGIPKLGGIDCD